jgi:hypothetical protein
MCQPRWWDESEQMHVALRPAGDQMFDTRAWRGPAVVGGDGIEPPTSTELAEWNVGNKNQEIGSYEAERVHHV